MHEINARYRWLVSLSHRVLDRSQLANREQWIKEVRALLEEDGLDLAQAQWLERRLKEIEDMKG